MREKYKKLICNRIKFLLKESNLTAEALAYQSGISKGGMSEILNCKKSPSTFTIAKICSGLNISLDAFYADKDIRKFVEEL